MKAEARMARILRKAEDCTGCRICELACSFHRKGVFSPELSSMKISRNNLTGKISWTIDSTCDLCRGEPQPLCVEYCIYEALSIK